MARSSLARTVRAASVAEPGGGSASVWGACVLWASTSVQRGGRVASDLGAAINRPAGAHERFLGWSPAAVCQAYPQRNKQRFCVVLRADGDLASVVIARGVNVADGSVPTILLQVPCEVSVVEDGCPSVAVRQLSPCRRLDHAAVPASAEGVS